MNGRHWRMVSDRRTHSLSRGRTDQNGDEFSPRTNRRKPMEWRRRNQNNSVAYDGLGDLGVWFTKGFRTIIIIIIRVMAMPQNLNVHCLPKLIYLNQWSRPVEEQQLSACHKLSIFYWCVSGYTNVPAIAYCRPMWYWNFYIYLIDCDFLFSIRKEKKAAFAKR